MINYEPPFLPYGRQNITEDDILAVTEVLRSNWITQGPVLPAFEQAIAAKVSVQYAIGVNSATSALHIACLALGLGPGDYLWTTPITFVASANCGRYCGAEVDFVDIDISTGLMSIPCLEHKLEIAESVGKLPKVIVPVHLAGSSCDMEAISSLSKRYGFSILEDASHAIGGTYKKQKVGSCRNSSITVFSFHPVKIITTGEGGMATTNIPELSDYMRDIRNHGIVRDKKRFHYEEAGPWGYEQQNLGFNYRITDLQAALGLSQLKQLEYIVDERNRLLENYRKLLINLPMELLSIPEDVRTAGHLAVVRFLSASRQKHKQIFQLMRSANIGVQLHYSPVHLQPYYRNRGFNVGDFPVSETYSSSVISLPLFPGLTEEDQKRVVAELENALLKSL